MRTIATLQEAGFRLDPPGRHRRARAEGRRAQDAWLPAAGVRRLSERDGAGSARPLRGAQGASTARRARKEIVAALLQQTNLHDVRKKKLGQLFRRHAPALRHRRRAARQPTLIIVDEPTAGLDPAERVRFLNLLSELGENAIVILSTHIVEDVSELCSRMAIINAGPDPAGDRAARRDRAAAGPGLEEDSRARRAARRTSARTGSFRPSCSPAGWSMHVYSEQRPDASFDPVDLDLEDVYFTTMAGLQTSRRRCPAPRPRRERLLRDLRSSSATTSAASRPTSTSASSSRSRS